MGPAEKLVAGTSTVWAYEKESGKIKAKGNIIMLCAIAVV